LREKTNKGGQVIVLYRPRGAAFWRSRVKYAQGSLLEGRRHGKWVFWYENGERQLEGEYMKGQKTGLWRKWATDGAMITEGNFSHGKMHGKWTDWHGNGQKALESHWVFGKRDGEWRYREADGSLKRIEVYDYHTERDQGFSIYTDLEEKEIVRKAQREKMEREWERVVGKSAARLVKPWHIGCWLFVFVPVFGMLRTASPWRGALFAGICAVLITSLVAWVFGKKGPSR
jgi:hypothetical protein